MLASLTTTGFGSAELGVETRLIASVQELGVETRLIVSVFFCALVPTPHSLT